MNNYEFYAVALEHPDMFFELLAFSIILHYIIFRRLIYSIIDPYFLAVITNVFCLVVVYLLYFTNNMSSYNFLSYNLTQLGFFAGLFSFRKNDLKVIENSPVIENPQNNNTSYTLVGFYFFSIVYLGCTGIIYLTKGIPLFMISRLETFANGGGSGVLGRITDVSSVFCLYTFFCVVKIDKFRFTEIPKYVILLLIFITYFLSGSKGSFLTVITVFWCYLFFVKVKRGNYYHYIAFLKRHASKIVIFTLAFVLMVIFVQSKNDTSDGDPLNPALMLALRFLHSGDIFWYAYPNNVYLAIDGSHGFTALFTDLLGLFRIYSWDSLPKAIGIILKDIHHPSDVPQGPNARHNIFGLIYYGFVGSILFSYALGLVMSFIRYKLPFILKYNTTNGFIFSYLIIKTSGLDSDPMLTLTYINNLLFVFPLLFLAFLVVYESLKASTVIKYELS